jgi:hypothetical protein
MTRFNWCNAVVLTACVLALSGVSPHAEEPTKRGGTDRKATDKKARITPEECERLVEQLVNPDKPPVLGNKDLELPKGVTARALEEKQKNVKPAYDKLSANIEDALPILAKHLNDTRFSYVYTQPRSGVYKTASVGEACSDLIGEHVEVYHRHVKKIVYDAELSLDFINDGCGGIEKWWKTRKKKTLAELQLEGIKWVLRQKKPEHFKSKRDWTRAKKALEKMAKKIRDSGNPIKVKHELETGLH